MRRLRPVTAWMRRTVQQVALERLGHLNDTAPGSRCAANEKNHGVREVHGTHGHAYSARDVQARALLGCCLISSANMDARDHAGLPSSTTMPVGTASAAGRDPIGTRARPGGVPLARA